MSLRRIAQDLRQQPATHRVEPATVDAPPPPPPPPRVPTTAEGIAMALYGRDVVDALHAEVEQLRAYVERCREVDGMLAENARLRGMLAEALDAWELKVHADDVPRLVEIRREAGIP